MMLTAIAASMVLGLSPAHAKAEGMAKIDSGEVRPVYPPSPNETTVKVGGFLLDRHPVTNGEFLAFVSRHPEWRRNEVKPLFADQNYLGHWAGPKELGKLAPEDAPVTRVSWFAASAYCEARGARLPTENEWELAAEGSPDDPGFASRILAWYAQPTPKVFPEVAQKAPDQHGVYDLHGLIWEWVDDFANTVLSDSRDQGDPDRLRFCGAGAVTAQDRMDYAAFMRVAFRSSLSARYAVANLGFRCAKDLPGPGGRAGR